MISILELLLLVTPFPLFLISLSSKAVVFPLVSNFDWFVDIQLGGPIALKNTNPSLFGNILLGRLLALKNPSLFGIFER